MQSMRFSYNSYRLNFDDYSSGLSKVSPHFGQEHSDFIPRARPIIPPATAPPIARGPNSIDTTEPMAAPASISFMPDCFFFVMKLCPHLGHTAITSFDMAMAIVLSVAARVPDTAENKIGRNSDVPPRQHKGSGGPFEEQFDTESPPKYVYSRKYLPRYTR